MSPVQEEVKRFAKIGKEFLPIYDFRERSLFTAGGGVQIRGGDKHLSARKWRGQISVQAFRGGKISVHRDLKALLNI